MSQLTDVRPDIDAGRTAKLFLVPERSTLRFTCLIKRVEGGYAWQHIMHNVTIDGRMTASQFVTQTVIFPDWWQLLEGIQGVQTETGVWELTDEPLRNYLPERKIQP